MLPDRAGDVRPIGPSVEPSLLVAELEAVRTQLARSERRVARLIQAPSGTAA